MSSPVRPLVAALACALLTGLCSATTASATLTLQPSWVPNGQVRGLARAGDTVYLGGAFDYVGPQTGSGVLLDATSGERSAAAFPTFTGEIRAVAADGLGGWYVAGAF